MPTLGQPGIDAKPWVPPNHGPGTWQQAKAAWFKAWGYGIHAPEVLDMHRSEADLRIVSAPARSSKSHSAAHEALVYGMPTEPLCSSLHWSIGPTYDTNREFQEWWRILVEQRFVVNGRPYKILRKVNNPANGAMEIKIEWGRCPDGSMAIATFQGKSATNPETLQGEEVTSAILSEAAEQPESIYTKYVESRTWKVLMPTTPKQKAGWIRALIQQGLQDPSSGIESFEYTRFANPRYNHQRFQQAFVKATLRAKELIGPHATAEDDPFFAEQFLGRWVFYTGAVLPFRRQRHVISPHRVSLANARICVSVDYGYEDPAVAGFWAVLPGGILFLFDEIYERHLATDAFVEKIQQRLAEHRLTLDYATGDPSRPEVARIMAEAGMPILTMDANAQRDREAGHRHLVDTMVGGPMEGYPGLYVSSRCTSTIAEWENLHYKEGFRNEYGSTALMGADHAFDMARYFVQTRPAELPTPSQANDLVLWQRIRRRERESGSSVLDLVRERCNMGSQERRLYAAQMGMHRYAA